MQLNQTISIFLFSSFSFSMLVVITGPITQDGEIWTFSVRAFESPLPERTINVNYEGFAEGQIFRNCI